MKFHAGVALTAAVAILASPALAGGGSRPTPHGAQTGQPRIQPQGQHGYQLQAPAQLDTRAVQGAAHSRFGGPTLDQRPDPNNQNPYRPMYSLDAVNPGETHPYFRTRKEGFGYPVSQPTPVYLGNGMYRIPR